jgi:DNA polymerase-3 subunit delta
MPEISHQKIALFLQDLRAVQATPIYLFHGDEFIYKKILEKVLDSLLPENLRRYNCIVLDGSSDDMIAKAVNELNTFSFLEQGKVVVVNYSGFFNASQNKEIWVDKTKGAVKDGDQQKAAQFFLNFLSLSDYSLDDLDIELKRDKLDPALTTFFDQNLIVQLAQYCREKKLSPVKHQDQEDFLQESIEKGFPTNHHLIITSDTTNRKHNLFKIILKKGLVVDCDVPKGERKASKEVQNVVLREISQSYLTPYNKSMESRAYQRLCKMTGFNLHVFSHNLQKLVDFVGDRPVIQEKDVAFVVERTRQDPIYAFTNAILDRNAAQAIFFLDSILHQKIHPLQVLTAMVKQIRNLLLAKDFVLSKKGKVWVKGGTYGRFTKNVLSEIEGYDRQIKAHFKSWQEGRDENDLMVGITDKKKKKKRSNSVDSDLFIKKKAASPYPIYRLMLRTDFFSQKEILAALERLSQADFQLKTSTRPPKLILEDVILFICKPSYVR